jgi:predicted Fe-Mo cluster-binding NifX family protein
LKKPSRKWARNHDVWFKLKTKESIMKIVVSATAPELSVQVDPRFGRCRYFVIVDPDSMEFEGIENTGVSSGGGAGIAAAQLIAGKKVDAVLTGNCGPNAFDVLKAAGIQVMTGVNGTVEDAIKKYRAGEYNAVSEANVSSHSGMGKS